MVCDFYFRKNFEIDWNVEKLYLFWIVDVVGNVYEWSLLNLILYYVFVKLIILGIVILL